MLLFLVQYGMKCIVLLQIVPVLYPREMEIEEPIVKDFMATDEFRYYLEDGEVILVTNYNVD